MAGPRTWLAAGAAVGCVLLAAGTWHAAAGDPADSEGKTAVLAQPVTVERGLDERTWPPPHDVGSFTQVATGTVYVDVPTAHIVWRSPAGESRVIGQLGQDAVTPAPPGWFWGDTRDVVGDPVSDVVAWVERVGTHAGQVVVVRASTGEQLARTQLAEPLVGPVVIASVDDEAVHFAAPDVADGPDGILAMSFELRGDDLWTWPWAAGQPPRTPRSASQVVLDVDGGVWALAVPPSYIAFFDASGTYLTKVVSTYSDRVPLGRGLSPGGDFWYGPAHGMLVETRTGERRPVREPPDRAAAPHNGDDRWGWTGPSTMTFLRSGLWFDCDAGTGACTEPSEQCSFALCNAGFPAS
jgi:hypothetical protein